MDRRTAEHEAPDNQLGFPSPRWVGASALVLATAVLVGHQAWYWSWTVDDAYITFRYSENLASGHGAVFNPGDRVEGYTNFLWMVILAALKVLGADTILSAKLLGAAFALALLPITLLITRRLSVGPATAATWIVPLLLAATPSFAAWSVAGLETPLFAFLLSLTLWRFSCELDAPGTFPWSGVIGGVATLTRPEGLLVFLLLFGYAAVLNRKGGGVTRTWLAKLAVGFALVWVPYMVWRLSYYGFLLPNTFYVKTGRGIYQWLGGVLYVSAGVRFHGGWVLHLLALVPLLVGGLRDRARPFAIVLLGWQAYNVYKGTDVLPMFRFFVPTLPIFYALAVVTLFAAFESLGGRLRHRTATALAVAFLVGSVGINSVMSYVSRDRRPQTAEYQMRTSYDDDEFAEYAARLIDIAPAGSSIAVVDAGLIPYMTGWPTIDRWGLCDVHIAHGEPKGPFGEKFDEAYVVSRKPSFIQTKVPPQAQQPRLTGWVGDAELLALPEFQRDYVRVPDQKLSAFFVRKELLPNLRLSR